jgi:hypothetical protein
MDTIENQPKQGADTTADLTKKKPQEGVLKVKSSTVSSDEGKLAAGISTTGLRTKRNSGAQRKKLVKERKMKEGTWIEKPNRNTPPSQDRGTDGNSGGVKRPHSDSNTPPKEKKQPKRPRSTQVRTGTYKEAVVGIKMEIVHRLHPDVNLDQAQTDTIQEKLLPAIDANPLEEAPPQFLYSKFAQGVFWITCAINLQRPG